MSLESWEYDTMDSDKKKMIIVGLDNAGKSTILLTMKRQLGPHNFQELQPTKGLQTEEFETDEMVYHVFDFGGQKNYREKYLERPIYFASTDILIFVIDIQDDKRFDLALKYLDDILALINDLGEKPDCSIFFHKFDPEISDLEEYQKRSRNLRQKIRQIFKKYSFSLKIYHTSIYTVFEKIQVM